MAKAKLKEEEKPSTSAPEDKFDSMIKTMEKLMDRLALGNTSAPPAQQEPQFRNPHLKDLKISKGQGKIGINSLILQ